MKTKNNVQKAILKSAAVVTSLVLISFTLNAQDYWKSFFENYSFNENDLTLLNNSDAIPVKADVDVYTSLEQETKGTLELESWMTDENYFTTIISVKEAVETQLDLKDWVTNEALFNTNSTDLQAETLEVENWMTDEKYFKDSVFQVIEETDTELKIEDWMLNESFFEIANKVELPLELEASMTSEEIW